MYINRNVLTEYPFHGTFYTVEDNYPDDGDMIGDDSASDITETVIMNVMCDIQETNKIFSNSGGAAYSDVYFKFDKSEKVGIKVGDRFKSSDWYRNIDGLVVGVNPTQMGGCLVHIMEGGV